LGPALLSILVISRYGLTPHEAKVSAIAGLRTPSNVSELRSVLGFLNYYRCYIPHYSSIAAALNALLQLNVTWKWGPDQLSAFQQLKDLLCQEGLALKRCDPGKPLLLYTDWSCNGIGAVLAQIDDNQDEYMVACISRSLNKHEKNYSSYEGEMLACVWAIKTLRSFLYGVKFTVVTDHQPLTWLMSTQELSGKHARWALSLMDYDFVIQHRPGQLHQNADVPSRFPRANSNDGTGARLDPDAVDLSLTSPTSPSSSFRSVLMSAIDSAQYEAFVQPTASASFMDDYAPTSDQMLAGHVGRLSDYIDAYSLDSAEAIGVPTGVVVPPPSSTEGSVPTNDGPPALTSEEQADRFLANLPALSAAAPTAAAVLTGKPDSHGVRPTHSLDTRIVPDFFTHAFAEGITVMDLFGGLCPGLDAVLRSGIQVKRYIYCDVHPPAQAVAMHRINILKGQYPHLLPHTAVANALTTVPHDARRIFTEELLQANALDGTQWLIIAGWDCAGFSSAGRQKGLHDTRSHTFFDALRIIGTLQQLQTNIPPAYILENSAIQFNFQNTNLRQYTFSYICDRIGTPVAVDAARFNSYAHRLRNFWSNLADAHLLHDILSSMHRQPGRLVNHILDPNCTAQLVSKSDRAPFYICNLKNRDMCALPTLVAYTNSRAFTVGKPGMIWDGIIKSYREPNVSERERALGYSTGATAAPGLSDVDRHQITGRCIDAFTLHAIFAALKALHLFAPHLPTQPQLVSACATVTPRHMLPPLSIPALLQHPAAGILMRHGWVPGQPLTSTRTGISLTSPLQLPHNRNRHGLGYAATVTELGGGESSVTIPEAQHSAQHALDYSPVQKYITTDSGNFNRMHIATHSDHSNCAHITPHSDNSNCTHITPHSDNSNCTHITPHSDNSNFTHITPHSDTILSKTHIATHSDNTHSPHIALHSDTNSSSAHITTHSGSVNTSSITHASHTNCKHNHRSQQLNHTYNHIPASYIVSPASVLASQYLSSISPAELYIQNYALTTAAEVLDIYQDNSTADIWDDKSTLNYLQTYQLPTDININSRKRIIRRAQYYKWSGDKLYRKMQDGTYREVPPPNKRIATVRSIHERCGHWGVKRTKHLLMTSYWWKGLERDVVETIKCCESCQRVRSNFNAIQPELQPLPIEGLFYRFACDLAGPFPKTTLGNKYIMVIIEYFSKHIELVPLPAKEAKYTAQALLSHVISRFGACAELVTDQGSEFKGAFHQLLQDCFIDHRTTSPGHPQADGLAERAVQSIKRALSKHCEDVQHAKTWDQQIFWIALGYRCSRQAATGLSPYQLLYGTTPVIPPAIKERLEYPIDLKDTDQAALYLLDRAKLLQQNCTIAMQNLQIAQHRDKLKYSHVRSGNYLPKLRKFQIGDFVYRQRRDKSNTLETNARPEIYRIVDIRKSGVLILQGRCGTTIPEHSKHCAPCHLINIDPTYDWTLGPVEDDHPCNICGSPETESGYMLLCDSCNGGYHLYCLQPPLDSVPDGIWLCPNCTGMGITPMQIELRRAQSLNQPTKKLKIFPTAARRNRIKRARNLDSRVIKVPVRKGKRTTYRYGKLEFLGPEYYPQLFTVHYHDGTIGSMDLTTAESMLCSEGTKLPISNSASLSVENQQSALPLQWDLTTTTGIKHALNCMMPGTYPAPYINNFLQTITSTTNNLHTTTPVFNKNLSTLISNINFNNCSILLYMGVNSGGAQQAFLDINKTIICPPLDLSPALHTQPFYFLQPTWYQQLSINVDCAIIFCDIFPDAMDLALPLAAKYARIATFVLVPSLYVTCAPAPRLKWIQTMKKLRLLFLLTTPSESPYVWLLLFKSDVARIHMLNTSIITHLDNNSFATQTLP
jgi:hypothetical protein